MAVLSLPEPAPTLAPLAAAHLTLTGLGNPVTAVLMAYRAIDTLLEVAVLLLAVIGIWSLAPDRFWRGRPGLPQREDPDGVLAFFARLLPPIGILVAIHLFWIGADAPGRRISERYRARRDVDPCDDGRARRRAADRTALAAAPARRRTGRLPGDRLCRLGDGLGFLAYPPEHAKLLIVAIEVPVTLSVATGSSSWWRARRHGRRIDIPRDERHDVVRPVRRGAGRASASTA